jgi:hypothetical protein
MSPHIENIRMALKLAEKTGAGVDHAVHAHIAMEVFKLKMVDSYEFWKEYERQNPPIPTLPAPRRLVDGRLDGFLYGWSPKMYHMTRYEATDISKYPKILDFYNSVFGVPYDPLTVLDIAEKINE